MYMLFAYDTTLYISGRNEPELLQLIENYLASLTYCFFKYFFLYSLSLFLDKGRSAGVIQGCCKIFVYGMRVILSGTKSKPLWIWRKILNIEEEKYLDGPGAHFFSRGTLYLYGDTVQITFIFIDFRVCV